VEDWRELYDGIQVDKIQCTTCGSTIFDEPWYVGKQLAYYRCKKCGRDIASYIEPIDQKQR
jgi:DNA-directed RNA polymerase subunit RPC12/RpoP